MTCRSGAVAVAGEPALVTNRCSGGATPTARTPRSVCARPYDFGAPYFRPRGGTMVSARTDVSFWSCGLWSNAEPSRGPVTRSPRPTRPAPGPSTSDSDGRSDPPRRRPISNRWARGDIRAAGATGAKQAAGCRSLAVQTLWSDIDPQVHSSDHRLKCQVRRALEGDRRLPGSCVGRPRAGSRPGSKGAAPRRARTGQSWPARV